jgi:hypothetical protein
MPTEETRWIPGYEGLYAITQEGAVWSVPRERTKGGWLSRSVNTHGYYQVQLGRGHVHEVHKLVARAWIGPCPAGQQVRHLNGKPLDIRLDNLAYGTYSDQRYDDVRNGVHYFALRSACSRGHEYTEESSYTRESGERRCRECQRERRAGS